MAINDNGIKFYHEGKSIFKRTGTLNNLIKEFIGFLNSKYESQDVMTGIIETMNKEYDILLKDGYIHFIERTDKQQNNGDK